MSTQLHHPDDSVPFARCEARLRRAMGPPEGRWTPECMCVDIECTGLAEPRVTFSSATMAGSMPAWAPLREGSRCHGPIVRL